MTLRHKIQVSLLFAIGSLAIVAAAFRLSFSVQYSTSPDISYKFSQVGLWSLAEVTIGFIVLCGPSVPKELGYMGVYRLASSLAFWTRTSLQKLLSTENSLQDSYYQPTSKHSNSNIPPLVINHKYDRSVPVSSPPLGLRNNESRQLLAKYGGNDPVDSL
ncbi:hypothetical protein F4777DRAFT_233058 [Nemania sp. FL0916]|nr:hypothetical protein F4777DRAFT_233058 [Nemania sp. FL0916]